MNKIKAVLIKSQYSQTKHLVIEVDGIPLDKILEEKQPENNFLGLVPTLLNWLHDKKEKETVWRRIVPKAKSSEIVPILMCPDDCDFSCTIIVAEVFRSNDTVEWRRFGIDNTSSNLLPDGIGGAVKWFKNIPKFSFNLEEYINFISKFRKSSF